VERRGKKIPAAGRAVAFLERARQAVESSLTVPAEVRRILGIPNRMRLPASLSPPVSLA